MKNLLFALILLSCSSKRDDPSPNPLIGNWRYIGGFNENCINPVNNSTLKASSSVQLYSFTEKEFTFSGNGYAYSGTYTIKGDSILIPALQNFGLDKRTFKVKDNDLYLIYLSSGCAVNNVYKK